MEYTQSVKIEDNTFCMFGEDLLKGEGYITIPNTYNPDTQLDTFRKHFEDTEDFGYCWEGIKSENYPPATDILEPGERYPLKLIPLSGEVSLDTAIAFQRKNNALVTGIYGSTAMYMFKPELLPKRGFAISLDYSDNLHRHWNVRVDRNSIKHSFFAVHGKAMLEATNVLVCFGRVL